MVQLIPWLEASSGFLFTNHKRALTGTQQVILVPEVKKVLNPVAPLKERKGSAGGHTLPDLFKGIIWVQMCPITLYQIHHYVC